MLTFETKTPEECAIPGKAVEEMDKRMERLGIHIHGYLLLSGRNIIAERYWEPYGKDVIHRMYSITKSFAALAVGLLEKEGRISLDDKICQYFPEMLPEDGGHPWCLEMTIRDMLSMRTCYGSTTFKRYGDGDWTESFFRVEPDHVPGTVFSYDTSSAHVLAALVEKLTGMELLDYMREKVLDKLGFSKEAYIMKDPSGVSQGGSGMVCTLRDVAKVAYLCNQGGILDGEELLPGEFLREAVACQTPTDVQPTLDEQCGYGYMIWMPREDGFVFYGMGGQLAVCFPKLDFCYLTMADTIGNPAGLQMLYDCFYDTVYPCLKEQRGEALTVGKNLGQDVPDAEWEKRLREETQNAAYTFYPNQMQWSSLCFDWQKGRLSFVLPSGEAQLDFGQGDWVRGQKFPGTDYACECKGYWKMGHFLLQCYVTDEEQGHVSMDFAWKDERLSVRMVSTNEEYFAFFKGFGSAYRQKE